MFRSLLTQIFIHIHTLNMSKKTKITIGILGFFVLCLLVGTFHIGHSSADELKRVAYEARQKQRRADCVTIASRFPACYSGDETACQKNRESNTYFTNEYGETPELACPQKDLPFGAGTGN